MSASVDYLPLLERLQGSFHRSIPADLDVPVPTCGEWTARELVDHLAETHVWAAGMARGVNESPVAYVGDDRAAHYAESARTLRDTLHELAPDAPATTLNGPGPASFWHRRQVHETLIHLHDLRAPLALEVTGVAAEVWADGVDEVVGMFYPRQVRLGRTEPVPYALTLVATDLDATWQLGEGVPTSTVSAPARELDLFLWGRIGSAHVAIDGNVAHLHESLTRKITP